MLSVQGIDNKIQVFWQDVAAKSSEDRFLEIWKGVLRYLSSTDRLSLATTSKLWYRITLEVEKDWVAKSITQSVRGLFCVKFMLEQTNGCLTLSQALSIWNDSNYPEELNHPKYPLASLARKIYQGEEIVDQLAHIQEKIKGVDTLHKLKRLDHQALSLLKQGIFSQDFEPWFLPCLRQILPPIHPHARRLIHAFYHPIQDKKEAGGEDLQDMLDVVTPYVQTRNFSALEAYFLGTPDEIALHGEEKFIKRRGNIAACIDQNADDAPLEWHAFDLITWSHLIHRLAKKDPSLNVVRQGLQQLLQLFSKPLLGYVSEEKYPDVILSLVEQIAGTIISFRNRKEILLDLWIQQMACGRVELFWNSLMRYADNKIKRHTDPLYSQAIVLLAILKPPGRTNAIELLIEKIVSTRLRAQITAFLSNVKRSDFKLNSSPCLLRFDPTDYKPTSSPDCTDLEMIEIDYKEELKYLIDSCDQLDGHLIPPNPDVPGQNLVISRHNQSIHKKKNHLIERFVASVNSLRKKQIRQFMTNVLSDRQLGPKLLGLLGFPAERTCHIGPLDYCFLEKLGVFSFKTWLLDMQDTLLVATKFAQIQGKAQEIYFPLALMLLQKGYSYHKDHKQDAVNLLSLVIQGHLEFFPHTFRSLELRQYWLASLSKLAHPGLQYGWETAPELQFLNLFFQKLKDVYPEHVLALFCDLIALCPRYEHPIEWEQWLSLADLPIWQAPVDKVHAKKAIFQRLFYFCPQIAKTPRHAWMSLLNPTVFHKIFPL